MIMGTADLREAIAKVTGAQPAHVQVTTGAEEALLILFFLAAEAGAGHARSNSGITRAASGSLGRDQRDAVNQKFTGQVRL
jgi:hypothetical protein